MPVGGLVGRRSRSGDLVGVPVAPSRWGVMVAIPGFDGDTYGLVKGLWSLESISEKNWTPETFPTPFITSNSMLREIGWRCVGFRPDLVGEFDPPSWLQHPSEANPGESFGEFGVENLPDGSRRTLSRAEAARRFLLLDGDYFRVIQPGQIVDLYREHFLSPKERAALAKADRPPPEAGTGEVKTPKPRSLTALKRARFFSSWKGFAPTGAIKQAEAAVREAIESLNGKSPSQAVRRLTALVRTFNKLEGTEGFEFGTIEAETIMAAIGEVAAACGIEEREFLEVDSERDF